MKVVNRGNREDAGADHVPDRDVAVHLIWGNDEYFVRDTAQKLVNELCPPANQALGVEVIEGDCDTIDAALAIIARTLEAVRTVGFMGLSKVVWLRGATFFHDGRPGKFEDVKKAVADLTAEIKQGLPPGQYLVITAPKVDGRSSFFKTCQAVGRVREHKISDKGYEADRQAAALLAKELAKEKLRADEPVLALLLQRIGTDSRQIINEITKLSTYLGERRTVTEADVRAVVCTCRDALAWDLTDAVGNRNLQSALQCLRQLVSQKVPPIMLIVMLENRFRELIVYRECLERRWLRVTGKPPWGKAEWDAPPEADELLGGLDNDPRAANPYRGARLADQAARFKMDELLRAHQLSVDTHEQLVTSGLPKDVLVEFLLVKVLKS